MSTDVSEPILRIDNLSVSIRGVSVLTDVSLAIGAGEALGLVGESGCGKSMTSLAVMGLLPRDARVGAGKISLRGEDLLGADEPTLCRVRGGAIGMIFQEPGACLDPVMRVGRQIDEALRLHRDLDVVGRKAELKRLLLEVGLNDWERVTRAYPHELSGGMQQRAMIATALAGDPVALIADEPTTALDARIAGQILDLLDKLRRDRGLALLLISHDLAVIGGRCDRVMVMYAGKVVESANADALFRDPRHPYTSALMAASPGLAGVARKSALRDIPGQLPAPGVIQSGCAFAARCNRAQTVCHSTDPKWTAATGAGQGVRCLQYEAGWSATVSAAVL